MEERMNKPHWSCITKTKDGKKTTVGGKNWAKKMAKFRKAKKK